MPNRKRTEAERQAMAERARAQWAARRAAPVAVLEPEESEEEDVLSQLAQTILKARDKKQGQAKILAELGAILDRIDPKEHPELADDPTVQAFVEKIGGVRLKQAEKQGLRPGSTIGTGLAQQDVPWKEADLTHPVWGCVHPDGTPQYVTFTPNETIPVWYNGIRCQFIADEEITVLKCFKDIYDEHKRLIKVGEQHKQYMFGATDYLPPELRSTDAAVSTARVRAFMYMGGEKGGGRIVVGYPGDAKFELREGAGETSAEPATT